MNTRANLALVAGVLLLTLPLAAGGAYDLSDINRGQRRTLCSLVTIIILCFWLHRIINSDVVTAT
jgi:hypothetical protein